MTKIINNLIKDLKKRKIIFGPKVAFKKLKKDKGSIEKIYLSSDCPKRIIEDIKNFKKKKIKIDIITTNLTKEELKELCKKPFNISFISILSEHKEEEKEKEREKKAKEKTKK